MRQQNTIQKIYSVFLLIIFSLSVLPKIYFHDVIANHKDTVSVCDHPENLKACLHQSTYKCDVDDLVVKAPYLILPGVQISELTTHFQEYEATYNFFIQGNELLHKENRGPPMV